MYAVAAAWQLHFYDFVITITTTTMQHCVLTVFRFFVRSLKTCKIVINLIDDFLQLRVVCMCTWSV
jgi:hypothetical protein